MDEQETIVMSITGATGKGTSSDQLCSTSYREFYGHKAVSSMANFSSHLRNPGRSGFTANNRPAIYYRPSLDHTDNPQMGILLSDSFISQTKRHYQPHVKPDGSGCFPDPDKPKESGFHQLRNHPKMAILEKKTEYQRIYEPKPFTHTAHLNHMIMGPKTESGFTKDTDRQPRKISTIFPRQTCSSVMRSDFKRPSFLQGNEATPSLCESSCRESGFTRGTITPLACVPNSNLPSSKTKQSAPTKKTIGKKEPTGSLSNAPKNETFPKTPFDHSHFSTHYNNMFCNHADNEKLKSGCCPAGIISLKKDYAYNRRDMDRFIFRD